MTVRFSPTLPGTRPDALFVTSGSQRIATVLLTGTGESPYALLQPASASLSAASSVNGALVEESGTLYALDSTGATVNATDASGKSTTLPLNNLVSAHGIAIDGAGVLYLLPGTPEKSLITYDTVRSVQGTFALPAPADTIDSVAVGPAGTVYAVAGKAGLLDLIRRDGSVETTSLGTVNPGKRRELGRGAGERCRGESCARSALQTVRAVPG